jgi:hypothetical protein
VFEAINSLNRLFDLKANNFNNFDILHLLVQNITIYLDKLKSNPEKNINANDDDRRSNNNNHGDNNNDGDNNNIIIIDDGSHKFDNSPSIDRNIGNYFQDYNNKCIRLIIILNNNNNK